MFDREDKITPIFIVGSPRSGTTLLGNYVGSGSNIANLQEYSGFFLSHYIAVKEYLKVPTPYKTKYLKSLQKHAATFATEMALREECTFYCDSTPWNLLVCRELALELPNAIFILCLRHYRGVLLSLERAYSDGYSWAGADWKERARLWQTLYSQYRFLPAERTIPFCYDYLCKDPERAISNLKQSMERLGVDISGLDEGQFSISHATPNPRATVGSLCDEDSVKLHSIPSYDYECWSDQQEEQISSIVKNTHKKLESVYPDIYSLGTTQNE